MQQLMAVSSEWNGWSRKGSLTRYNFSSAGKQQHAPKALTFFPVLLQTI